MGKLTKQQDAFGQAMWDYFHGAGGFEIVERDDGGIAISSGPAAYVAPFKDWPTHQKRAIRLARGRVLDIGCGAGRVALHLQDKGLDAMGIDVSPLAIKACKTHDLWDPIAEFDGSDELIHSISSHYDITYNETT